MFVFFLNGPWNGGWKYMENPQVTTIVQKELGKEDIVYERTAGGSVFLHIPQTTVPSLPRI